MFRALSTAATGMNAQQMNIEVISNNLANVNTNGFKRSRVDFHDLFYQTYKPAGAKNADDSQAPTGIQVGLGVAPVATQKIFTEGDYQQTDKPLDLFVEGDGFFKVTLPDGSAAYTRSGSFTQDGDGKVVTPEGYPLEPNIVIPQDAVKISIASDGTVTAVNSAGDSTSVGTLELARFVNPSGLSAMGRNLYQPTTASGEAITGTPGTDGFGMITQGAIETSNVKVVEEMVNMIMAQRAYEVNSKVIKTSEEMVSMANNLRA